MAKQAVAKSITPSLPRALPKATAKKAKLKTAEPDRETHTPSTSPDPVFAAIQRHAELYEEMDRAVDARNRLEIGGGPNEPGFEAADRKACRLTERHLAARDAISMVRPTSPEGMRAAAIYLRERYVDDHGRKNCADELTIIDAFVRMTKAFATRRRSPAFQRAMAIVDGIKAKRAKRAIVARKWRKSAKAKRAAERMKQITSGPTLIEVSTEAKTLRRAVAVLTAMVPGDEESRERARPKG